MRSILSSTFWRSAPVRFFTPANRLIVLGILMSLVHPSNGLAQTTRYVKPSGSGFGTGASWTNASASLQAMINASAPGDQVWVAQGTYKPTTTTGSASRFISFAMKNGVAIYGGFVGNETSLSQRPAVNPVTGQPASTTLSGDIGTVGNSSDNSFHVIHNNPGLTNSAVLDGFVITGGNANGNIDDSGGGILNTGSGANNVCSPTFRNCMLTGNTATYGGGMFNDGDANGTGLGGNSSPMVINCVFQNNSASQGGGMFNNGWYGTSNSTLTNCVVKNNTASTEGGGVYNIGGDFGNGSPVLTNCVLMGNTASRGGAFFSAGTRGISPVLTNCSLMNNSAANGGAFFSSGNSSAGPVLTNCIVFGNGGSNTIYNNSTTSVVASYSFFEPSVTGYTNGTGNLTTTNSPFISAGSMDLNPCSSAVGGGNPASVTVVSGPYSATALPTTDLTGNPRIVNGRVDMGATEYQGPPPTVITQQPVSGSAVCPGSSVSTSVSVNNPAQIFAYQWYKDGTILPNQTSATLNLTNVQTANAGSYSVVVTALCYSLTSTAFTLTVNTPPSRLYVNANATGANTGLSWADAFTDLQRALTYGCSQNLNEIWVASGTYKPTSGTDRYVSFAMKNGVAIYGGFVGNETNLSQRPLMNPVSGQPSSTTLSGDIGTVGNNSDNSFHVVTSTGLANTAVLDGFVITGGNASVDASTESWGGGVYSVNSSPTLRNCELTGNVATRSGGAMTNDGRNGNSSPTLINCMLRNNSASQVGGAIFNNGLQGTSSPTLINCALMGNSASQGGAIYTTTGSPTLINCSLYNNSASQGGALFNSSSSLTLTNCILFGNGGSNTFVNNSATVSAGYSLFEPSVTGYNSSSGNLTNVTSSPFISVNSVALAANSPAINTGNPTSVTVTSGPYSATALPATDLAGNPRIVGCLVDMGAVEYQTPPRSLRLYVNANATGAKTGLSWADAFTDLQSALTAPCPQSISEIWVAGGVYKPTPGTDRSISFVMLNDVAIYGGFVGSETSLSQRPLVNPVNGQPSSTTLSGDIGTGGNTSDNAYHVIHNIQGLTTTAVLDGFVITGGNANGSGQQSQGGGVYNDGSNSPSGNLCSPTFRNCLLLGNTSTSAGGAMFNNGNAGTNSPVLMNCVLQNNSAPSGGAMYNNGPGGTSHSTLTNCVLTGNTATNAGGAIYNNAGNPSLTNCVVTGNSAFSGGAMYNSSTFFLYVSKPVLTNCVLMNNSASNAGGALYNYGVSGGNSSPVLTNCSLTGNSAPRGGALFNFAGNGGSSLSTLANCIFFGNGGGNTFVNNLSSIAASYSLFEPSVGGYTNGAGNLTDVASSPFVSATSVALNNCSPAINAGDPASTTVATEPYSATALPSTDQMNNPRIVGGRVDMGAVEFQAIPNVPLAFTQPPAAGSAVCVGAGVTIPVSVSGTVTTYQWYKDGAVLSAQTSATLSLNNVQIADKGSYQLVVTGTCNNLTSTTFS